MAAGCAVWNVLLYRRGDVDLRQHAMPLFFGTFSAICAGFYWWRDRCNISYIHQHGVRQWRLGRGERALLYQDVGAISLSFHSEAYNWLACQLVLTASGPGRQSITLRQTYYDAAVNTAGYRAVKEVEQLGYRIASDMAAAWQERLQRGERVPWLPKLQFAPAGLEIKDPDGDIELLAWKSIKFIEANEGEFRLWLDEPPRVRLALSTAARNFHPGYFLLHAKIKPPTTAEAAAQHVQTGGELTQHLAAPFFVRKFTIDLADHLVELRQAERADPGIHRRRFWFPTACLAFALCLAICFVANLSVLVRAASILATGGGAWLAVRGLGWLERKRVFDEYAAGLQAARQRARAGAGADPFPDVEIALFPWGCRVSWGGPKREYLWQDLGGVEWLDGYVEVWRPATPTSLPINIFYLPPRVFTNSVQAFQLCHELQERIDQAINKTAS